MLPVDFNKVLNCDLRAYSLHTTSIFKTAVSDSGGGRGDEMGGGGLSNMLTLVFHILSLSELQLPGQQRLDLNERDEAFITRFFEMNGFRFRNRNNNGFYFDVGNRSVDEIVLALDCLKDRLKSICFSRFCGEIVNGREISQPEDIVLSFGIHATYGDIPGIPSTNMFI